MDLGQLLQGIAEAHEQEVDQLRDDLRAMRARDQQRRNQAQARRARGERYIPPSIQDCLHWLDNDRPHRNDNLELDMLNITIGQIERLLGLIGAELNQEDMAEDPNVDIDAPMDLGDAEDRNQGEVGPIRPTGRAARARQPYTVSSQARKTNWFEMSLEFDDRTFRDIYRVSKRTFWSLVDILSPHEVFISRGRRKQRPVYHQLGVFLIKCGLMAMRVSFLGALTSIGEGTTLVYCRRVVRAIRTFGLECVGWPNAERKREIKAAFKDKCGLDGVIGLLDGTLIDIAKQPDGSDASFISRKGTIATSVQAIVDHEGRFISFETGFPGSKNDTYIWKHSFPWQYRLAHFDEGEFLLADGGYPLSHILLIPFGRNERAEDGARKRQFNKVHSSTRSLIERTFGALKGRFPALHMMSEVDNLDDFYRTIEAMFILHNMCYDLHDTVSGVPDAFTVANENPYDAVEQEPADAEWGEGADINEPLLAAGRAFRLQCMDLICPE